MVKIKTKYNVVVKFITALKVENMSGKNFNFVYLEDGGKTIFKIFEIVPYEVI